MRAVRLNQSSKVAERELQSRGIIFCKFVRLATPFISYVVISYYVKILIGADLTVVFIQVVFFILTITISFRDMIVWSFSLSF